MLNSRKQSKRKARRDQAIFNKINFAGVQPSPPDDRDFTPDMVPAQARILPKSYEAPRTKIINQLNIGSCVAHACATGMMSGEKTRDGKFYEYSRGYIYGNRASDDYKGEGMFVREALKQLNHCGDVFYDDFPYNQTYNDVYKKIQQEKADLAKLALPHAITNYYRCYTESDIKSAIMDRGGVIISVPVYSDFSRDLHKTKTNISDGYHCMIIVGWNANNQWIVQNSWGCKWGYDGRLLMDMDYPVSEYWAITVGPRVAGPKSKFSLAKSLAKAANAVGDLFVGAYYGVKNCFIK